MKRLVLMTTLMLAAMPAFANDITATGNVVSIEAETHIVKIRHDPIPSLGWPAMTMNFTADSSIDLSGYQAGDAVSFTLKPIGKDDYVISGIKK